MRCVALAAVLVGLGWSGIARAHDDEEPHEHDEVGEVHVRGEREGGEAASRTHATGVELELRPRLRPADLAEAVPGLFAVQHAGGGKANQYFLRGFDADHGTDVAFFVDGVPVNMPSHAHGQGYTDLHFVIPELVTGLDGYKGPYFAHLGDFATAGAVAFKLADATPESSARVQLGPYGVARALVIESPHLGDDWRGVFAGEAVHQDGPFANPERLQRYNFYGRVVHDVGARARVSVTAMSYGSAWNGSGQIPERAVCGEGEAQSPPPAAFGRPCIDRYGFVDPSEGGQTRRHQLSANLRAWWDAGELEALAYAVRYDFALFSNFTFFAEDARRGDEIEQDDGRTVLGADVRVRHRARHGAVKLTTTAGVQARADLADVGLRHVAARVRLEDRAISRVTEGSLGAFAEEDLRLGKAVRFVAGARVDRVDVLVADRAPDAPVGARGAAGDARLSPKLMAVVTPARWLDVYADWGRGFHTNDARGAVLPSAPARLITPATGWELGVKVAPAERLGFTAAAFLLDLDSELVWSGDAGTTSASGATRRYGLELGARLRVADWLFADADATFTHAAFRANAGNDGAVTLAPRATFTAGVAAKRKLGDFTPFGSVRVKAIGDRPASPDGALVAKGFGLLDVEAGLRWRQLELAVDVQNLLDTRWNEVSFANTSRLPWEPAPVTGIHFSPGWPRTVIGRAAVYW